MDRMSEMLGKRVRVKGQIERRGRWDNSGISWLYIYSRYIPVTGIVDWVHMIDVGDQKSVAAFSITTNAGNIMTFTDVNAVEWLDEPGL